MIEWWKWLSLSANALRDLGEDPADRQKHVALRRPLPKNWIQTIGKWSLCEPPELRAAAGYSKRSEWGKYDVFKHRHGLLSRTGFRKEREFETAPFDQFGQVIVASFAHIRVWSFVRAYDVTPGEAAIRAVRYQLDEKMQHVRNDLGILPTEALRYFLGVEYVLMESGVQRDSWWDSETSYDIRTHLWERYDGAEFIRIPPEALGG